MSMSIETHVPKSRKQVDWINRSQNWAEMIEQAPESDDWMPSVNLVPVRHLSKSGWLADRLRVGMRLLEDSIEFDPDKCGGIPLLRGTRVSIAQVFGEIADDVSLSELADDLDLDRVALEQVFRAFSIYLERPGA